MKKACLILLTFVCAAFASKAQDVITLTNGTQIQSKVLEINPGDVRYKDYSNLDGPVITIQKSGVSEIKYANGTRTIFNNGGNANTNSGSAGYKREVYTSSGGYKKRPEKSSQLHGWYFGFGIPLGISNATSQDPTYGTLGSSYSGVNLLATKMFNQHIGIQFGLGTETYSYEVDYNLNSQYGYGNDLFSLSCLTIPVRAIYISNSKRRAGLYVMAGVDLSFVAVAKDQENDDLSSYYNSVLISPFVSSGVAFRNRNARAMWMFGLYYKTTLSNCYSSESANSGTLNSAGLSIEYMGKFGRSR